MANLPDINTRFNCIEVVNKYRQEEWEDDGPGVKASRYYTYGTLLCDCGEKFEVRSDKFMGKAKTLDCGCGVYKQKFGPQPRNPNGRPPKEIKERGLASSVYLPIGIWARLSKASMEAGLPTSRFLAELLDAQLPE